MAVRIDLRDILTFGGMGAVFVGLYMTGSLPIAIAATGFCAFVLGVMARG